jgi:flagellar basal-body rod protein FlgB
MGMIDLIEKALDIRAFYQRVLATNIANVETPGYKEKEIDFKTELERLTGGGMESGIRVGEKTEGEGSNSVDDNTVTIEGQIVKMTENTLMFNSLVQLINKKFTMIRYAINEGRK